MVRAGRIDVNDIRNFVVSVRPIWPIAIRFDHNPGGNMKPDLKLSRTSTRLGNGDDGSEIFVVFCSKLAAKLFSLLGLLKSWTLAFQFIVFFLSLPLSITLTLLCC